MADTALDAAIQQPDGDLPDGAVASSAACMTYCTCMDRHCKAVSTTSGTKNYEPGMTMAGCLSACASLSSSAITCRTTHCMNVANNPTTAYQRMHCPHAAGEAICQ